MYYADTTNLIFSSSQVGTGMATTGVVSTNVIDLQSAPTLRSLGVLPMFVRCIVTEAFAAVGDGGSEFTGVTVEFRSSTLAALTGGTTTTHASKTVLLAALTLGSEFVIQVPKGQDYQRYLGLWYASGAEVPSAGKITAVLVPSTDSRQYFADGSGIVAG